LNLVVSFFHVQISIGAIATQFLTHENSFIRHVPFHFEPSFEIYTKQKQRTCKHKKWRKLDMNTSQRNTNTMRKTQQQQWLPIKHWHYSYGLSMAIPSYVLFTTIDALISFYIPKSFVHGINTPSLTLTSITLQGNFI